MASRATDQKFRLKVQLLNGELHEFDVSRRATVDKVKEMIFNHIKSLSGASRLDYQLGFTPESRLTVEFVKFPDCHEDIKKKFEAAEPGMQVEICLSLFPRSSKKLQRQLSVSNVPNLRNATITHKKLGSMLGGERVFDFKRGNSTAVSASGMPEPLRADLAQVKEEVLGPAAKSTSPRRPVNAKTFSTPTTPAKTEPSSELAPPQSAPAVAAPSQAAQSTEAQSPTSKSTAGSAPVCSPLSAPTTPYDPKNRSPLFSDDDDDAILDGRPRDPLSGDSSDSDDEGDDDDRRNHRSKSFSAGDTQVVRKGRLVQQPSSAQPKANAHLGNRARAQDNLSPSPSYEALTSIAEEASISSDSKETPKTSKKKAAKAEKSPKVRQVKTVGSTTGTTPIEGSESATRVPKTKEKKERKEKKEKEKEKEKKSKSKSRSTLTSSTLSASAGSSSPASPVPSPKVSKKLDKTLSTAAIESPGATQISPRSAEVKRKKSGSMLDSSVSPRSKSSAVNGHMRSSSTELSSQTSPRAHEMPTGFTVGASQYVVRTPATNRSFSSVPTTSPAGPRPLNREARDSQGSLDKMRNLKDLSDLQALLDGEKPPSKEKSRITSPSQSPASHDTGFSVEQVPRTSRSEAYGGNSATPPSKHGKLSGTHLSRSHDVPSNASSTSSSPFGRMNGRLGAGSMGSDDGPLALEEGKVGSPEAENIPSSFLRLTEDDAFSTINRGSRMSIATRNRSNSLLGMQDDFFQPPNSRRNLIAGMRIAVPPNDHDIATLAELTANARRNDQSIASQHSRHLLRAASPDSRRPISPRSAHNSPLPPSSSRPSFAELRSGSFSVESHAINHRMPRVDLSEAPDNLETRRTSSGGVRGSVRSAPPLMKQCRGFWVEVGRESITPNMLLAEGSFQIENAADEKLWYAEYFAPQPHFNYIGVDSSGDPFVLSVIRPQTSNIMRALLRTRRGDERQVVVESKETAKIFKTKIPVQELMRLIAPTLSSVKMRLIKDLNLIYDLMGYEERLRVKTYKFGLLLCKEGQTKEEEMFSNEYGSEHYDTFLSMLGDTVQLQGFEKFRGGLDTERNATGTHSIYTQFEGNEIMFHVSTMLPFSMDNPQQLERKRHLGNDIVVLVFKEGNTPYIPNNISSEFIHVVGVVQPEIINDRVKYRFSIASKDGVPPFSPHLPASGFFEPGISFRNLILTKLINGERAAYKSQAFAGKMQRTRQIMLKDMDEKYK